MKHLLILGFAVILVTAGSGCSIIDRLFLLNVDGPYGNHSNCRDGQCESGTCPDGECVEPASFESPCENGGCTDAACTGGACADGQCATGGCHGRQCRDGSCDACQHHGRYGGLAKHHLTRAERRALEMSGYGDIGPAGPPTGAVAYPYYTTRGPRDFLAKCPPSIGP